MTQEMQQLLDEMEQRLKQLKILVDRQAQKEQRSYQRNSLIQTCMELERMYQKEGQLQFSLGTMPKKWEVFQINDKPVLQANLAKLREYVSSHDPSVHITVTVRAFTQELSTEERKMFSEWKCLLQKVRFGEQEVDGTFQLERSKAYKDPNTGLLSASVSGNCCVEVELFTLSVILN